MNDIPVDVSVYDKAALLLTIIRTLLLTWNDFQEPADIFSLMP